MKDKIVLLAVVAALHMGGAAAGDAWAQSKESSLGTRGAGPITIDNGVTGEGAWQVSVDIGGDTDFGELDAVGFEPENLIFEFLTYVDDDDDGTFEPLSSTAVSSPPTLTGTGEVTSSGSFAGPNGTINWTAVATIPQGETVYEVVITFDSASAFGDVRVINYFDQDIFGVSDDVLILLGTPGQADFQMLTLDDTDDVGVGHFADYFPGADATYLGFAADEFSDLRSTITSGSATFSINGDIDTTDLPPYSDPRFPAADAFGPADITGAYGFDLNPTSTQATLAFALGGSISGEPVAPGPDPDAELTPVPMLSNIGMLMLGLIFLAAGMFAIRRVM
ncbi:MAG: hypothetical protein KGY48_10705 [Wenzhouxiangellaceae bacterium]|nr:hypothetical protein [Wenzhouxiangellaceae bacterium]